MSNRSSTRSSNTCSFLDCGDAAAILGKWLGSQKHRDISNEGGRDAARPIDKRIWAIFFSLGWKYPPIPSLIA